tara:strand:+ start:532 stop:1101 length:570 start_codon:yes stop_codon:yes gene_type:complete
MIKLKKNIIAIILSFLFFDLSFADISKNEYTCTLQTVFGTDHPSIKFPLKIIKSFDDDYVIYSHGNILRNEVLVFGQEIQENLIGYIYDENYIQAEFFTPGEDILKFYVFEIDREQTFPYPLGESIFVTENLYTLTGTTQKLGLSSNLDQETLDKEKKIMKFIKSHLDVIIKNEKPLLIDDFEHKCKIK